MKMIVKMLWEGGWIVLFFMVILIVSVSAVILDGHIVDADATSSPVKRVPYIEEKECEIVWGDTDVMVRDKDSERPIIIVPYTSDEWSDEQLWRLLRAYNDGFSLGFDYGKKNKAHEILQALDY
jgi:hypothetical protein